jgi:hypothetical protein
LRLRPSMTRPRKALAVWRAGPSLYKSQGTLIPYIRVVPAGSAPCGRTSTFCCGDVPSSKTSGPIAGPRRLHEASEPLLRPGKATTYVLRADRQVGARGRSCDHEQSRSRSSCRAPDFVAGPLIES